MDWYSPHQPSLKIILWLSSSCHVMSLSYHIHHSPPYRLEIRSRWMNLVPRCSLPSRSHRRSSRSHRRRNMPFRGDRCRFLHQIPRSPSSLRLLLKLSQLRRLHPLHLLQRPPILLHSPLHIPNSYQNSRFFFRSEKIEKLGRWNYFCFYRSSSNSASRIDSSAASSSCCCSASKAAQAL